MEDQLKGHIYARAAIDIAVYDLLGKYLDIGVDRNHVVPSRDALRLSREFQNIPFAVELAVKIPVSSKATTILEQQRINIYSFPFPVTNNALRLSWDKLKKRAAITDFTFHDLRHEVISRLFEVGLSLAEVTTISGHKDSKMLFIYTHLKAEEFGAKL